MRDALDKRSTGYRGALDCHLTANTSTPTQRNNSDVFCSRRAAFYQSLKSKVGLRSVVTPPTHPPSSSIIEYESL